MHIDVRPAAFCGALTAFQTLRVRDSTPEPVKIPLRAFKRFLEQVCVLASDLADAKKREAAAAAKVEQAP